MLKIRWYWWVSVSFLLLLLIGGESSPASIPEPEQVVAEVETTTISPPETDVLISDDLSLSQLENEVIQDTAIQQVKKLEAVDLYEVIRVIDGDTIEVWYEGAKRSVRYIGIDTPETVHPSKPVECMGKEASDYNTSLVAGKFVRLERDISDTDKYGRLLRYVYVDAVMINEVLVREGYANVMTYPPDVKYHQHFLTLEQEARRTQRGLWSDACTHYVTTAENRYNSPVVHAGPTNQSCNIKGNISASGEKIFHVPGCQSYEKTIISEEVGERWFCSEQQALDAGWRKALNCR